MQIQLKTIVTIFTLLAFISCNDTTNHNVIPINASRTEIVAQSDMMTISTIIDTKLSGLVKDIFTHSATLLQKMGKSQGLVNVDIQDFDFDNLYQSTTTGVVGDAIVINYKGNTDNVSFSFVVFRNQNNELLNPMLIKTIAGVSIDYGVIETGSKLTLSKNQKVVTLSTESIYSNANPQARGCGQATADCIVDAYSNHGWASVYIFVQTAFLPQTAAGIAIACAGKNCF